MRYNRLYKDNNFLTPTTYTQTLSEYTETLRYEDILCAQDARKEQAYVTEGAISQHVGKD